MPKEIWTDDQLASMINSIKTGDKATAKALIANYADDIYFRIKMIYKDKEAVSAAYQNTCKSLIDHIDSFNASEDDFSKWIDTCTEAILTASILPIQTESSEHEYKSSDDQVNKNIQLPEEEKTLRHGVEKAMNMLTIAESAALCSRHYDHRSIKETAEKLNCTEENITELLANAKAALHENHISYEAVVAAMHKLNPVEEKEPEPVPVIPVAAAAETKTVAKPSNMKKWLIPAVAAVALIAGLAVFVSSRNSSKPNTADNAVQTTETEKQDNKAGNSETGTANKQDSTDNTPDNSTQSGSASQSSSSDNGFHGLHVEESITDTDLDNSPSVNPGNQSGTASSSGNPSSTPAPASGGQSGNSGENTGSGETPQETEPAEPGQGEDSSNPIQFDEEVDLGNGEIVGGF